MAVIWFEDRVSRTSRPLSEPVSDFAAMMLFKDSLRSWPGTYRLVFDYECLLYLNQQDMDSKKPWGLLFVEFLPHEYDPSPLGRRGKEEGTAKW